MRAASAEPVYDVHELRDPCDLVGRHRRVPAFEPGLARLGRNRSGAVLARSTSSSRRWTASPISVGWRPRLGPRRPHLPPRARVASRRCARRSSGSRSGRTARCRCRRAASAGREAAPGSRRARGAAARAPARPLLRPRTARAALPPGRALPPRAATRSTRRRGREAIDPEHDAGGTALDLDRVCCIGPIELRRRARAVCSTQPIGVRSSRSLARSTDPETIRCSIARVIAT